MFEVDLFLLGAGFLLGSGDLFLLEAGEEGVLDFVGLLQSGTDKVAGSGNLSALQLTKGGGGLGLFSEVFLVRLGVVLFLLDLLLSSGCFGSGGRGSGIGIRSSGFSASINGTLDFGGQFGLALVGTPSRGDSLLGISQGVTTVAVARSSVVRLSVTNVGGGTSTSSGSSGRSCSSSTFTLTSGSVLSGSPSFTLESRLGVLGGDVVTGRVGLQDVSGSASAVVSTSTSTGLLGSLGSGNLSGGLGCLGGLLGLDGSLGGGGGRAVVAEKVERIS